MATPGSRSTGGICSARPPASTAHRSIRTASIVDRRRVRSHTVAPTANVPTEPGGGSCDRVVQGEPGVDPTDAVDERDPVDAVVDAFERLPVLAFHRGVDRTFGGGECFVLVEGGAVLRIPALDEDPRHGAYRTRAPGQLFARAASVSCEVLTRTRFHRRRTPHVLVRSALGQQ